eukprot:Rhum_TRINITY_DN14298_c6_g1::Rhum_TRINITY_DN14298_c6_g1_i1::g.73241::m.73241
MSLSGKVKSWSDEKGFGFIIPNDGSGDVFVHRKVQGMGMQSSLIPGKEVQYDVVIEKDRPKASLVTGDGVQKVTKPPTLGADFRQIGTIKNMNIEKGYGFITPLNDVSGQDIFVLNNHTTGTLVPGQRVSYSIGMNPKTQKPWAENVVPEVASPYAGMGGYDPAMAASFGNAMAAGGMAYGSWPQPPPGYGFPSAFGY